MSNNPISTATLGIIKNQYREKIKVDRASIWPIIHINSRFDSGIYTPIEEIGSSQACLKLGEIFSQEDPIDREKWSAIILQDKSRAHNYFQKMFNIYITHIIEDNNFEAKELELTSLPLQPTQKLNAEARAILLRYCGSHDLTQENIQRRALLLANKDSLCQSEEGKKKYFKALPDSEQKRRVHDILTNHLISKELVNRENVWVETLASL